MGAARGIRDGVFFRSRVIIGHDNEGPSLEFRIDGNDGSRRFEMVRAEGECEDCGGGGGGGR